MPPDQAVGVSLPVQADKRSNNGPMTNESKPGLPATRDLKLNSTTKVKEGRYWDAKGPQAALRIRDGKPKGSGHVENAEYQFADHAYRVKDEDGEMHYLAEPYHLNANGLADLAWLAENGWNVRVSNSGRHADSTLLVSITKVP